MLRLRLLLLVSLASVLFGCGGGGGGGSTNLVYTTDWANSQTAGIVTGNSQKVNLYDASGGLVDSKVLNNNGATDTVTITGLKPATYRLLVQICEDVDGNGGVNGTVEQLINPGAISAYTTVVGGDITKIRVTPSSKTITVPQSTSYYAVGLQTDDTAVFTRPSDFEWSVTNGIATVDANGKVSATNAGNGTVRARHTPTNLAGSANLEVLTTGTRKGKWTVLVYMNAANDLSAFDTLNINQMEEVANNPDVRFVVQWKQVYDAGFDQRPEFIGTRRYLIEPDATTSIRSELVQDMGEGVDMGDYHTLQTFLTWGKTFYPADRYVVVVWNHGNGWRRGVEDAPATRGVSYDDDTGNHIDTWDMPQAIAGTKWDILSWDASLMQMMEVNYEIKGQASFIVGSEESPPGQGLPYQLVFQPFQDNPNASTAELSKAFVDGMLAVPGYQTSKITQSVIDTSKLDPLRNSLSSLASALIANKGQLTTAIPAARNATKGYSLTSSRQYYDIGDLCDKIDANTSIAAIHSATQSVRTSLADAVVWEGHNSHSAGSHGLSIDFSPSNVFNAGSSTNYAKLNFAAESTWDEWLSVAP